MCVLENLLKFVFDCLIYYKICCLEFRDVIYFLCYLYYKLWDLFYILKNKFRDVMLYKLYDGSLINFVMNGDIIVMEVGCILIIGF